jgi:hypothetical protein
MIASFAGRDFSFCSAGCVAAALSMSAGFSFQRGWFGLRFQEVGLAGIRRS